RGGDTLLAAQVGPQPLGRRGDLQAGRPREARGRWVLAAADVAGVEADVLPVADVDATLLPHHVESVGELLGGQYPVVDVGAVGAARHGMLLIPDWFGWRSAVRDAESPRSGRSRYLRELGVGRPFHLDLECAVIGGARRLVPGVRAHLRVEAFRRVDLQLED